MSVLSKWNKFKTYMSRRFKEREAFIRDHLTEAFLLREAGRCGSALYSLGQGHFLRISGKPNSGLGLMAFETVHYTLGPDGKLDQIDKNRMSFGELKRYAAQLGALYQSAVNGTYVPLEDGFAALPYSSLPWVRASHACKPEEVVHTVTHRKDGFVVDSSTVRYLRCTPGC